MTDQRTLKKIVKDQREAIAALENSVRLADEFKQKMRENWKAEIHSLWEAYYKMPVLRDFQDVNDYDTALFTWCVEMEKLFCALGETPTSLVKDYMEKEGESDKTYKQASIKTKEG